MKTNSVPRNSQALKTTMKRTTISKYQQPTPSVKQTAKYIFCKYKQVFNLKIICLICLILICVQSTHAGGKGGKGKGGGPGHIIIQNDLKGPPNVPIYMPIPFPIPMPMPHKPHIPNQHPHGHYGSNHESGGAGDGEIKKIYILQPMGRLPNHSTKGGGGSGYGGTPGPVQHMPSPVNYNNQRQPQSQTSYPDEAPQNDDYENNNHNHGKTQDHHQHRGGGGGGGSYDQMKILPIVVIPPIAPMSPIQLNSPGHTNNPRHQSTSSYNDQKTFADYGGSGGGSAFRIRSVGGPFRSGAQDLDDLDDYDSGFNSRFGSATSWRSSNSNADRRYVRRRLRPIQARRIPVRRINSIRDIMEQSMFDDDPGSGIVGSGSSNRAKNEYLSRYSAHRYPSSFDRISQADERDSSSLDYDYKSPASSSSKYSFMAPKPGASLYSADDNSIDLNELLDSRSHGLKSRALNNYNHRDRLTIDDSSLDQLLEGDESVKSIVYQEPARASHNNETSPEIMTSNQTSGPELNPQSSNKLSHTNTTESQINPLKAQITLTKLDSL